MLDEACTDFLLEHSEALICNSHGIPFLLDKVTEKKSHRARPRTRHIVRFRTKRYTETDDCCCGEGDCFCKCNWDTCFESVGGWGDCLTSVLPRAIKESDRICRCEACGCLCPWTVQQRCATCHLHQLEQRSEAVECPICQESSPVCEHVRLNCTHHLCPRCLRNLYLTSPNVRCPLCRTQQSKDTLAALIPPACEALPSKSFKL